MAEESDEVADAFAAIGNEHRIAILRALMNAYQEDETPLPYSELMRRAGMSDSGQFNYHLTQLAGRFVAEREEGYELTYAGRMVDSAVASGTLDSDATVDPKPVEGTCYACGEASLVLRYPESRVRVTCTACDEEVVHMQFPPASVADRSVEELKRDFDRRERAWLSLAGDRVCPECAGRLEGGLAREVGTPATGNAGVRVVMSCERCWVRAFFPPAMLLLDHPAITSFFWQRGIDLREVSLWQLDWALSDEYQTVLSEEPLAVRIDVDREGARLSAVVEDDLSVDSVRVVHDG